MDATPAKWNVLRVIWVPGSPMLWAQIAPTAEPGSILDLAYFSLQIAKKRFNWDTVQRLIHFKTANLQTDRKVRNKVNIQVLYLMQIWQLLISIN